MKKALLLFVMFLCTVVFVQAQESSAAGDKRHDLRFMANDLFIRSDAGFLQLLYYYEMDDYYYYYYYPAAVFNRNNYGLGYRFRFGKNALRLNAGFNYSSQKDDENTCLTCSSIVTKFQSMNSDMCASLGYQRDFVFGKCHLYTGVDGKFMYSIFDRDYTVSNEGFYYPYNTDYASKSTSTQLGGGIFAGVEYFFVPVLSMSIETSLDYLVEKNASRSKVTPSNSYMRESKNRNTRNHVRFNPLSTVSVNIHL